MAEQPITNRPKNSPTSPAVPSASSLESRKQTKSDTYNPPSLESAQAQIQEDLLRGKLRIPESQALKAQDLKIHPQNADAVDDLESYNKWIERGLE